MDINEIVISDEISIREAIKKLDSAAKRILIVLDEEKLIGVVNDGDIRRWILKNGDLSEKVKEIVNYNPKVILENNKKHAKDLMQKYSINCVPVVDINYKIKSVIFWDDEEIEIQKFTPNIDVPVVIMAGGLGTRLYPYTKILPKPLIPIGDIPICERIMDKFNKFGMKNFFLAVNYKKNMIKAYFEDLSKNYNIEYIEEEKPLGTGGSLYLLKNKINSTFFVSNCDILVDGDYYDMYMHHKKSNNKITIISVLKNMTVPYGVIDVKGNGQVSNMTEKPEYSFLTNTGVYIIEPEILDLIEDNKFIHLPDIAQKCIENDMKVGIYPITESAWIDMGQINEMEKMIERLGV